MKANCIFCKVVSGAIPSPRLFEDDQVICIRDIQPQAQSHFLVLPKEHVETVDEAFPESGPAREALFGRMFAVATRVAVVFGFAGSESEDQPESGG